MVTKPPGKYHSRDQRVSAVRMSRGRGVQGRDELDQRQHQWQHQQHQQQPQQQQEQQEQSRASGPIQFRPAQPAQPCQPPQRCSSTSRSASASHKPELARFRSRLLLGAKQLCMCAVTAYLAVWLCLAAWCSVSEPPCPLGTEGRPRACPCALRIRSLSTKGRLRACPCALRIRPLGIKGCLWACPCALRTSLSGYLIWDPTMLPR
jgi:hypothetical protein